MIKVTQMQRALIPLPVLFAIGFLIAGCSDCKSSSDCGDGKICVDGKCKTSADQLKEGTGETEAPGTETDIPSDPSTDDASDPDETDSASGSEEIPCDPPQVDCPKPDECEQYTCEDGVCVKSVLSDIPCADDGDECTANTCRDGECVASALSGVSCESDDNDCTADTCVSGVCEHLPKSGDACGDDGNPCTNDICEQGICGVPLSGTACDSDDNPCTTEVCQAGACKATPLPDATPCDDGTWCNGSADRCEGGECVPLSSGDPCDPSLPCVNVICHEPSGDEEKGTCEQELLSDVSCDDGLYCNGEDICDEGVCMHIDPPCHSEDLEICEVDICDEDADACSIAAIPDGDPCREQDGLQCNGIERCQAGTCTAGSPFCPVFNDCSRNVCHEGEAGAEPTCDGIEPDRDHEPCGTTLACDGQGDRFCLDGICSHGETPPCPELHQDGNLCTNYVICFEQSNSAKCLVENDATDPDFASIDCDQTVPFDTLETHNEVTIYDGDACSGSFGGGEQVFMVSTPNTTFTATIQVAERTILNEDINLLIVTDPCDAKNTCTQSSTEAVSGETGSDESGVQAIIVDGANGNRGRGSITLTCP